jgi:predicted amidohydrolase YtcJ
LRPSSENATDNHVALGGVFIKNVELLDSDFNTSTTNVRIAQSLIQSLGDDSPTAGDQVIDADGNLLLPGLHDHHTHLIAYAASLQSVSCGPPDVHSEADLMSALCGHPGSHWLRGTGFHESVLPHLNRQWLDAHGPDRPIKIQHRTGRLWILNRQAMEIVNAAAVNLAPHERDRLTSDDGRLYDVDELLGNLTRSDPPPVEQASERLAAFGVTGINDMTPSNDPETWNWFAELQRSGKLMQKVRMSGRPSLSTCADAPGLSLGETKVHLHESALPDFHEFLSIIEASHKTERNVAVHCVTEVELVFTLSAFRTVGSQAGDRIEHGSVIPPALIEQLRELALSVITQPNFVYERGDAYLRDIPQNEHDFLYRVGSLAKAGVATAFGTDLPFGAPDPWQAMDAATKRTTISGLQLGSSECVTAETALAGYLGELDKPTAMRTIKPAAPADCCLLDTPWQQLRRDLSSAHVCTTLRNGETIYSRD